MKALLETTMYKDTEWTMFRMLETNEGTIYVYTGRGDTKFMPADEFTRRYGRDFLIEASEVEGEHDHHILPNEATNIMVKWRKSAHKEGFRGL